MNRITENLGLKILIIVFLLVLASSLIGCKSTQCVTNETQNHIVDSNEMVSISQSGVGEQFSYSIFTEWMEQWNATHQQHTNQQDTEEITETVTTTTDSLGNSVRTEQRTTNRTTAKQTSESSTESRQQYLSIIDSLLHRLDSLSQCVSALSHVAKTDSIHKETEKVAKPSSFFRYGWAIYLIVIAVFAYVIYLIAQYIRKLSGK